MEVYPDLYPDSVPGGPKPHGSCGSGFGLGTHVRTTIEDIFWIFAVLREANFLVIDFKTGNILVLF
jgi:hypothetical protein